MAERERGQRRHLCEQPDPLEASIHRVGDVLRVGIERRQRADRAEQHPHRMRVVAEPLEKLDQVRVDVCVDAHLVLPGRQLGAGGQLALEQEIRGLEEARLLGQLLDRVAAIAEDPRVAVDVRDRASAVRGVEERRVVRGEAAVSLDRADLPQIGGADRAVDDRHRVLTARAVVDDCECLLRHGRRPLIESVVPVERRTACKRTLSLRLCAASQTRAETEYLSEITTKEKAWP